MAIRTALFTGASSPLEVCEIDLEAPSPDEVRVRMAPVGVCGNDLNVVAGGTRPEEGGPLAGGCFMGATVLTDLSPDAEFATQEVFGPAVAVSPADSDEEALELANRSACGLSAAIFTRDLNRAKEFVSRIGVGLVHANSQTAGAHVHVPFGGLGGGSYGHEQGRAAIDFYTQDKTV